MPSPPASTRSIYSGPPAPGLAFSGWCWKGGSLALDELATYRAGLKFKQLGIAEAQTGPEKAFPVLFRIYAHGAQRKSPRSRAILFPADCTFWVREVRWAQDGRVFIGLEQCLQGADLREDFETAFGEWLNRIQGELVPPSGSMLRSGKLPFARWGLDAEPGDPPLSGVIYDLDEAVQFAAAFTGEPPTLVRRVLEARERYLELAGLAVPVHDEEDPEVIRAEREEFQALLPEEPTFVDNRETDYLVLVTRIPRPQVLRIVQGETAYEDHLGLITWDSDEERATALGLQHPQPSGAWEAIFQGDRQACDQHLERLLHHGARLGTFPSFMEDYTRLQTTWLPSGSSAGTLGIIARGKDHAHLLAAYPMVMMEPAERLVLLEVAFQNQGLEAFVVAEDSAGTPIRALIPAPFASASALEPGNSIYVQLSIWTQALERLETGGSFQGIGTASPPPGFEDGQTFVGQIEAIHRFVAWGQPLLCLRLRSPGANGRRPLCVLMAESSLVELGVGDHVHGRGQAIAWPLPEDEEARTAVVRSLARN
jgi:hypothetical protein